MSVLASANGNSRVWVATITSTAPVVDETTGSNLELVVVDRDSEAQSHAALVDGTWDRFEKGKAGWARRGLVTVPDSVATPGAVLVRKLDDNIADEAHTLDYLTEIRLATEEGVHEFPVNSWVSSAHGQRVFFDGRAYLPKDTPPSLADDRERELEALRAPDGPGPKETYDRAYGWQVYDDLGTAEKPRPALGGSAQLPYPRHLANDLDKGQTGPGKPWLPFDEQFDSSKQQGFNGDLLKAVLPAVAQGVQAIDNHSAYDDFNDVLRMFRKNGDPSKSAAVMSGDDVEMSVFSLDLDDSTLDNLDDKVAQAQKGPLGKLKSRLTDALDTIRRGPSIKDLLKFKTPRVLAGRGLEVLESDEEWGRQVIAGMNPCALVALTKLPSEAYGSAIGPQHVDKELAALGAGKTMAELVADAAKGGKPRLFMVDYMLMDTFWKEAPQDQKGHVEHAGRCLLFLQQDANGQEQALVPLAIELKHRKTAEQEKAAGRELPPTAGVVYARQELGHSSETEALWWLARSVFRSLDSGYHQLISHWLRTHCCMEPFLIALRRQLSAMHPVHKLMLPHFRFTLDINSKARSSLISAGGIIESVFTPGAYAMRLSSAAYAGWRFRLQAPPADLAHRGMLDKKGQPWIQDYPYASDGLDIWNELNTYFAEYLSIYYKNDKDVKADPELQAWWAEVKEKGHPDMDGALGLSEEEVWGFAGPIDSLDRLVHVLATIAWTTSAHHAAVNFGQYDFASLLLNVATLVRRPVPNPSNTADPAYKALAHGEGLDSKAVQKEVLTYLSDPLASITEMVTVQLLSIHAEGEQTLDERNALLVDEPAVEANERFMRRMQALEAKFQTRNADPTRWTRFKGDVAAQQYTLLIPPSPAGLTMKGVPYSISI